MKQVRKLALAWTFLPASLYYNLVFIFDIKLFCLHILVLSDVNKLSYLSKGNNYLKIVNVSQRNPILERGMFFKSSWLN